MENDGQIEQPEVKSGWSANYLLLTLTLSLLTGGLGYGLKWLFEPAPRKIIGLSEDYSPNLLDIDQRARAGIIASFSRKEAVGKPLAAYYECSITVTNDGSEGVEDVEVTIDTQDPKLQLGDAPSVSTSPRELASALKINRITAGGNVSKQQWTLGLLNPRESASLRFVALSSDPIPKTSIQATARKKDWETLKVGQRPETQKVSILRKPLRDFTGIDILFLLVYYLAMSFAFNLYAGLFWQTPLMQRIISKWRARSQRWRGPA
ncbi:MAG: hypothetical protein QOC70_2456 [Verrucomicrobiota bacterium]|jgi:hypothetical protein